MEPSPEPPPPSPILLQIQTEVSRRAFESAARPPTSSEPVAPPPSLAIEWLGPPLQWGEKVTFGVQGGGLAYLRGDWSQPETDFVWSDGPSPSLLLPSWPQGVDVLLVITATPFPSSHGFQLVTVMAAGIPVASWHMRDTGRYCALLPGSLAKEASAWHLTFQIGHPTSPKSRGMGDDPRNLGLALRALELRPF